MANSYVEYTTAGSGTNGLSQTTFTAPTKFLSINDIRIKGLNGSTWTELTISSRGTTTVTLSATPTSGSYSKIRVFRSSTTEPLIDFQNGSRLSESDLDTAYQQGLFVAQEVAEDADPEGGSGIGNIVSSQLANVSITNSNLAGGITNDKLAGSISQDKLAGGITSAQLAGSIADSKLASGVGTSANNLVKLDGTAKLPAVDGSQLTNTSTLVTGTTVATTSGTAIDFTGIPSTAKRISVIFRGVSSSGSDTGVLVQLGTSGGLVTSGYLSTSHYGSGGSSDATGFYMYGIESGNILSGIMTIAHMGSNIYVNAHSGKYNTSNGMFGGGDVSVGGTVDRLRIKQSSGGAFDAGSVNIMYES